MINAQDWLNQKFPTRESKENVKVLVFFYDYTACSNYVEYTDNKNSKSSSKEPIKIEGDLDLSEFISLESLDMSLLPITSLKLKCAELTRIMLITCSQLTTIQGLENCSKLTEITFRECPKLQTPYTFLDSWKQEIQTLKAQLIELLEKIQTLQTQITAHQQKETNYQQQIQQKEQAINQKQTQITNLQSQLTTKTTTEKQAQTKITQLEKQITNLQAEKQALHEKLLKERQEALAQREQEKIQLTQEIQLIKEVLS